MKLDFGNERSIYLQIAESIEDDILSGALPEEEQIPSTNQMAVLFKINPATAGKGINLLAEKGIVYKKRGIGMFVAQGSKARIIAQRRKDFFENYVVSLLREAKKLGISRDELANLIASGGDIDE